MMSLPLIPLLLLPLAYPVYLLILFVVERWDRRMEGSWMRRRALQTFIILFFLFLFLSLVPLVPVREAGRDLWFYLSVVVHSLRNSLFFTPFALLFEMAGSYLYSRLSLPSLLRHAVVLYVSLLIFILWILLVDWALPTLIYLTYYG